MALPADPALRHRVIAAEFSAVVTAVRDWSAPAPVEGWAADDVVDHLLTWLPGFLGTAVDLPVAAFGADTLTRWRVHVDGIQAVLDDPGSRGRVLLNPHVGEVSLPEAIDRFYTSDVFMHTWDIARAAGLEARLDEDECEKLLAGMIGIERVLRESGQFGPAFPVADSASVQDRLVAFIGRDPAWSPPR